MFGEALSAAQSGQRARAIDLLTRLIKTRPDNPEYWVWMSAVVSTSKERVYCLKEALRFDPQNAEAQRGLTLMGVLPPNPELVLPAGLQKRAWQSKVQGMDGSSESKPHSARQMALIGAAAVIVIALISIALVSTYTRPRQRAARPVIFVPTGTVVLASGSTPEPVDETSGTPEAPGWTLAETYTPTPLYVNTPHSASEAYRIGQRAYERSEWGNALNYFQQALAVEPDAADIQYYIGECYRQQEELDDALESYDAALELTPNFAPALLGRARVLLAKDPKNYDKPADELEAAIEQDPNLGEAYLELARLQIRMGETQAALRTLQTAEKKNPDSALVFLYRAEAYLAVNNTSLALRNARQANEMDVTLLPAYRMIGETLQVGGDMRGSIDPLKTYLHYTPEDAEAWAWLAKAQYETNDGTAALRSLEKSLDLDNRQMDGRMLRAQLLLEDDRAEEALKDYEAVLRSDPQSFEASMGAAQALIALKYPGDAYQKIEESKRLAVSEKQKAEWQYWRARSLDALGEKEIALRDYRALVALPKGTADPEWLAYASRRIAALDKSTATPTAVKTKTPTPAKTKTPARTPTRTR